MKEQNQTLRSKKGSKDGSSISLIKLRGLLQPDQDHRPGEETAREPFEGQWRSPPATAYSAEGAPPTQKATKSLSGLVPGTGVIQLCGLRLREPYSSFLFKGWFGLWTRTSRKPQSSPTEASCARSNTQTKKRRRRRVAPIGHLAVAARIGFRPPIAEHRDSLSTLLLKQKFEGKPKEKRSFDK